MRPSPMPGYCLQVFWPGNLAVYYPFPQPFRFGPWRELRCCSSGSRSRRFAWPGDGLTCVVGWLWYLVTLLPVMGLIQLAAYSHADRYTYVPLIGVFVGLTWGAARSW